MTTTSRRQTSRGASSGAARTKARVRRTAPADREERIAWLPVVAGEPEDPDVRSLFERARERLGFIPNVFKVFAARPERFKKWRTHFNEVTIGESELTPAEREMIAVAVSAENHCLYCLTSHGAGLRQALGDQVLGDRITLDYRRAGLDERATAMLDYAAKITTRPVECSEADIDRLRSLGFSDQAIWDIIETAAMYNFTNRIASASGMLPNREYHMIGRTSGD
ncbi:MAG: peroxidase-related enzyme [Dehalococcoidia bacterium]